jgi:mRNA deadenylase 3'-5' endonuclease subunit Ccr4
MINPILKEIAESTENKSIYVNVEGRAEKVIKLSVLLKEIERIDKREDKIFKKELKKDRTKFKIQLLKIDKDLEKNLRGKEKWKSTKPNKDN